VEIWPNVHILGRSSIETGVRVMPGVWIRDSAIGASSTLGIGSIIEGTPVEKESVLAPYTRISRDA